MKRLILLVICISFCLSAIADSVTPQQAAKKAESFFSGGIRTKSGSSVKLVWTWPDIQTKASNGSDPLLYVFERDGGGFAIVAGEDAAHPILGYSATGSFSTTDMPDNLRSFLGWYGDVLQCARDNHWSASPEMREEWNRGMTLADLDNEQSVQLETAQWGQGSPYNDLCPVIDGVRCPSGCVATATAIIMRYHQWPKRGTGEIPSYDYNYKGVKGHVDGYSLGHEYQWDNMPMKRPESGYTEEQSKQLAQLLYDVGVMAKMKYSPDASGAVISGAAKGLLEYYDYDKNLHRLFRDFCYETDSSFEQTIINEIQIGRPVLFRGDPAGDPAPGNEGHAMVIDGFKDRLFSINFGWNGARNGYYNLTPIMGHNQDLVKYYKTQEIIYNIQPNRGNDYIPDEYSFLIKTDAVNPCFFQWNDSGKKSFTYSVNIVRPDPNFELSFEYCIGHFDKENKLVEYVTQPKSDTWYTGYNGFELFCQNCEISKEIKDGDQIKPMFRFFNEGQWQFPISMERSSYIVFDINQPLSESIEFGFSNELFEDDPLIFYSIQKQFDYEQPSVFLRIKKDLDVSLYMGDTRMPGWNFYHFYDNDKNEMIYRVWLDKGQYKLIIKDVYEDMTIRFKL